MKRKCFSFFVAIICVFSMCLLFASLASAYVSDSEFFKICKTGSLEEVNDAILEGVNTNARSETRDDTPIMAAASGTSDSRVIKLLIESGADISRRNNYGETPLMHAAGYNLNQKTIGAVIQALVEEGDDVNAKDNSGKTPLMWAVKFSNLEAVIALINLGADAREGDNFGTRPLDAAEHKKEFRNTAAVRKLREASAIK